MKMSIRTLLAIVAFCALGIAGLTQDSVLWLRLIFSLAVVFLVWSVTAAVLAKGSRRTFWIGAAIFGGGYYVLMGATGLSNERSRVPILITHQLLVWSGAFLNYETNRGGVDMWEEAEYMRPDTGLSLDPFVVGSLPLSVGNNLPRSTPPPSGYRRTTYRLDEVAAVDPASVSLSLQQGFGPPAYDDPFRDPNSNSMPPLPRTTTPPPGFRYPARFFLIGHSLFLIIVGITGGLLARWQFGGNESVPSNASSTPVGK